MHVLNQLAVKPEHWYRKSKLSLLAALLFAITFFFAPLIPAALAAQWDRPAGGFQYIPETIRPTFTLSEAVAASLRNFPSIRTAKAKVHSAKADITLAKTAYLPNFDLLAQGSRNSQNVVNGTIMPQSLDVIPMQSGRESGGSSFRSFWNNNMGANFNWLLYDFGLRHSNVLLSRADTQLASASVALTELDVAYAAGDSYLEAVIQEERIKAVKAMVNRMEAAALTVHTLVDNGLRPGVDAARADYELSVARIALIETEKQAELARVDLAEKMGLAGTYIAIDSRPLTRGPKSYLAGKTNFDTHPLALVRKASVEAVAAKVRVLDKTWRPHLWMNTAMWGRGTNAQAHPVWGGILPQVANWAASMEISFPVMDIFEIEARRNRAIWNTRAERANLDLAIQILEKKDAQARVLLRESRRIASETPVLVASARENQIKTLERYKVGLTNMVSVAESERILAKSEVENAVAQVRIWQAILAIGYVQGNLRPFLSLVAAAEGANP